MPALATKTAKKKPEELTPNAFIGWARHPSATDLSGALGNATQRWDELVEDLARDHGLKSEWNSYSQKYGWSLRIKRGDRNIVYLIPFAGGFRVAFILGASAMAAARRSVPRELLLGAKKYPEGTGIRFDVNNASDVHAVKQLVIAKLES